MGFSASSIATLPLSGPPPPPRDRDMSESNKPRRCSKDATRPVEPCCSASAATAARDRRLELLWDVPRRLRTSPGGVSSSSGLGPSPRFSLSSFPRGLSENSCSAMYSVKEPTADIRSGKSSRGSKLRICLSAVSVALSKASGRPAENTLASASEFFLHSLVMDSIAEPSNLATPVKSDCTLLLTDSADSSDEGRMPSTFIFSKSTESSVPLP
mmetsp:Transcript_21058/g.39990  ORF Transcript_21058/g.39990 Transcript_21058/m.39990 type:complete len:213 (-) Transcript_21058:2186-2824(-)